MYDEDAGLDATGKGLLVLVGLIAAAVSGWMLITGRELPWILPVVAAVALWRGLRTTDEANDEDVY